jgi:hypothetical protein
MKGAVTPMDRWVFTALTVVSLALIAAAVIRNDQTYLNYLSGPATLVLLYFLFVR